MADTARAEHTHHDEHAHTHHEGHEEAAGSRTAAEEWDDLYRENERKWSGRPNAALVREFPEPGPGTALDLGCGEGADAIWLARGGRRVTAVDVSRVALERGAAHAEEEGVADRIDWQWHDLAETFPEGTWDLVSSHFLHSWTELPRERILRRAVDAVAPGGTLLIVGHAEAPDPAKRRSHSHGDGAAREEAEAPEVDLPTSREVLESLDLPEGEWEVQRCEEEERTRTMPDGTVVEYTDTTLRLRRLPV
ncbi:class I SAM-dependent methyltransferase [Streptomyces calidiresistens]|uniref:Methyltransferase domain-containing protein n=1 Tax=Streptomyces calidiresistens TaxID=1485586 RepID=A0A7W3XZG7_9ACTN|nr:class I SAM-dependent methyltransferase [Streptomyces calidiresistens]MBB0232927.1 methyltransferase domain-containing protein [Streptomyces calidiresistens]